MPLLGGRASGRRGCTTDGAGIFTSGRNVFSGVRQARAVAEARHVHGGLGVGQEGERHLGRDRGSGILADVGTQTAADHY